MIKQVGGPALPSHGTMGEVVQTGMTLRDYFAGQALAGLLACPHNTSIDGISIKDSVSKVAYLVADRMLEARDAD